MSKTKLYSAILLPVIALAIAYQLFAAESTEPKITISKETTYITEPLRADGYPDYVAALNQQWSKRITPESNAVVKLLKAFGPSDVPEEGRVEFYKILGVEPLSTDEDFFVPQQEIVKRWRAGQLPITDTVPDDWFTAFEPTTERPWSAQEFPAAMEWLKANEKPLQLIIDASKCSDYFVPFLSFDKAKPPLLDNIATFSAPARSAKEILIARAMNSLDSNDLIGAWNDIQSVRRLARLVERGHSTVSTLYGNMMERVANDSTVVLLNRTNLTQDQFETIQKEYNELPQLRRLMGSSQQRDLYERFFILDLVCSFARNGKDTIGSVVKKSFFDKDDKLPQAILAAARAEPIDWDLVLKAINQWWDRWNEAEAIADPQSRKAAIANVENERQKLQTAVVAESSEKQSLSLAEANRMLADGLAAYMTGGMDLLERADKIADANQQMIDIAFALSAYRLKFGKYPNEMAKLVPQFLAKLSSDPFSTSQEPFKYRVEGEAYAIWTVGPDGIDDGGKDNLLNVKSNSDDQALRPLPRPHK